MSDTVRALETYWIPNGCNELRCKFCGAVMNLNDLEQLFYCPKCNELMVVVLPAPKNLFCYCKEE